jgi:hypothetical protein
MLIIAFYAFYRIHPLIHLNKIHVTIDLKPISIHYEIKLTTGTSIYLYCIVPYITCITSHNLYLSPDVNRVIRSRWMRWVGHVALTRVMRNAFKTLVGKPE